MPLYPKTKTLKSNLYPKTQTLTFHRGGRDPREPATTTPAPPGVLQRPLRHRALNNRAARHGVPRAPRAPGRKLRRSQPHTPSLIHIHAPKHIYLYKYTNKHAYMQIYINTQARSSRWPRPSATRARAQASLVWTPSPKNVKTQTLRPKDEDTPKNLGSKP